MTTRPLRQEVAYLPGEGWGGGDREDGEAGPPLQVSRRSLLTHSLTPFVSQSVSQSASQSVSLSFTHSP